MSEEEKQEVLGISTSIRVPPLWRDKLRLWFAQFEAIVSTQKKGDKANYELLVAQLERQDVDEVGDLLLNPPEDKKYEALKDRLLEVYATTESNNLHKLLHDLEFVDMKPSQLLRRMQTLANKNISDVALRILWMNRLPVSVRAVIAVSDSLMQKLSLSELALMADKVYEQTQAEISAIAPQSSSQPQYHSPQTSTSTSQHTENHQTSIEEKVDFLVQEIAELKMRTTYVQRGRPRQRNWSAHPGTAPFTHPATRYYNILTTEPIRDAKIILIPA